MRGARTHFTPEAHPRSRGENLIGAVRTLVVTGSSPLTRGKLDRGGTDLGGDRLIPAHAGKTRSGADRWSAYRAHPRSRGENPPRMSEVDTPAGSSPLTRGKRVARVVDLVDPGLIPAHAGKTRCSGRRRPVRGAHPRSRGENSDSMSPVLDVGGSSPLTRGKPQIRAQIVNQARLIPAHAGKTS